MKKPFPHLNGWKPGPAGLTVFETETGPRLFQAAKKPDWTAKDRRRPVFCCLRTGFGLLRLNQFKTGFFNILSLNRSIVLHFSFNMSPRTLNYVKN
jgi:hypothetical protein